ncbi:alpha/beta hydrolase [Solicola sp. PLA-1-18]|uniref:alpha/beta hydrolase n=1 Tax=Solicola sp. PLA-1-18 TaxID=3380532 RepID=UPI003B798B84
MKKLLVLVSTLAAVLAGAVALPAQAQPAPRAKAPAFTPRPLTFGTCANPALTANKIECGTLVVPLDYAKPKGATIKLAVSRLKHRSSAADYQGIMLTNPGGPGGSGLSLSVLGRGDIVPGTGDDDYDWIGFDPRGVGSSTPSLSCDPDFTGYDRPNYVPTTRALEKVWLKKSERYATACKYADGARLLNHVKTTDSVKDMESIRKALGQERMNFYGFSYGTYLAQVYATQHPTRVRRFVMDGNVDPTRVWYRSNLDQDLAFEKTIQVWFDWVGDHDDVYGLGDSGAEVRAAYEDQLEKLDAQPAQGKLGPDELNDVLLSAGYYVFDWDVLGHALSDLVNRGDATALLAQYPVPGGEGADNGTAMYLATVCTDAPWPESFARIRLDNWRTYAEAPFETWANAWFNGPCLTWPGKASTPVKVSGSKVDSRILLVSETLDAATPYSGSLKVRSLFPSASLIEGVGGTTHAGSLNGVACVDDAIGAYLKTGAVPARVSGSRSDLQCDPVPAPTPTPAAGAPSAKLAPATSGDALVRQALQDAQLR